MKDILIIICLFLFIIGLGKFVANPTSPSIELTDDKELQQQLDNWQPFD